MHGDVSLVSTVIIIYYILYAPKIETRHSFPVFSCFVYLAYAGAMAEGVRILFLSV